MSRFLNLMSEYGESHQNKINILIHKICVPLILFSIIGLLMCLPKLGENLELVFILLPLVSIYYFVLSVRYALFITPIMISMVYLNSLIRDQGILLYVSLGIFIVSWIFQFIGHKIEGKKPSFFKDLQFLLIGPLWVVKTIFRLKN